MQAQVQPLSGAFDDGEHLFPIRVFYEDTDAAGIVYYANYLKFAERARTEAMRLLGLDHQAFLVEEGLVFVVRRVEVDYLQPARLDDAVLVRTRFTRMGAAYVDALQRICRDATELARVSMRVACVTRTGLPARIPPAWRELFKTRLFEEGAKTTASQPKAGAG